jgi:hypothetical protein
LSSAARGRFWPADLLTSGSSAGISRLTSAGQVPFGTRQRGALLRARGQRVVQRHRNAARRGVGL